MSTDGSEIAIIGMAGRFPGAPDVDSFWSLLLEGTEQITFFDERELLDQGIAPEVIGNPRYVPAKGVLGDAALFDAAFFDYSPHDAAVIDPQHRVFLECAWHALEHAGIDPSRSRAPIGVYAGATTSTYLRSSLRELSDRPDFMEIALGNEKDHLATRTSYKLDLRGPAVLVQSACSTSLVAVHLAVQGLLSGDCGVALAGGVSVMFPEREGYLFHEEGIYSHDGHCRAFDAGASGTVPGDGVALVVLKLLDEALADGDTVHAVIRGTAINNDGAGKVGYTAPSIAGQAEVIRAAHRVSGVEPDTIGYLEAHGTGTALGDPVEIAALTRAFRTGTDRTGFCAIGSAKSAIGHLNTAAGAAGLIKAVLAVEHGIVPPAPNFTAPNPAMNLASSPFYISTEAAPWPAGSGPRRAGVSSFGLGGTNAHVVLEQAPLTGGPATAKGPHLLLVSAKTPSALDAATADLAAYLERPGAAPLADVAFTTRSGRKAFPYRRFVVCADRDEGVRRLTAVRSAAAPRRAEAAPVALLFPGQGTQHAGMGAALYRREAVYREIVDRCAGHLPPDLWSQLRPMLTGPDAGGTADLDQTALSQPALFMVEYALAGLWKSWGVQPVAMLGHSIGEYVAACLAGVFTLEDALTLVVRRGRLMQEAPAGTMLSVQLSAPELRRLPDGVAIAAVNAPDLCTVSGPEEAIAALSEDLAGRGVAVRRLHTTRAFHSPMMAAAADELRALVAGIEAKPPRIPFVSNVTGDWITGEEAVDPGYWARHTLAPVRFADGLATLVRPGRHVLLEAGPGQTAAVLARRQVPAEVAVVASMPHPSSSVPEPTALAEATGALWAAGVTIDWTGHGRGAAGRRVPLPPYPFERRRHWLGEVNTAPATTATPAAEPVFSGPYAETARAVAAIWQELLGVAGVGPGDDFFQLGGHSLLGTRLTTRLRETFGADVRLRDLFAMPTVEAQAQLVNELGARGAETAGSDGYEEGEL